MTYSELVDEENNEFSKEKEELLSQLNLAKEKERKLTDANRQLLEKCTLLNEKYSRLETEYHQISRKFEELEKRVHSKEFLTEKTEIEDYQKIEHSKIVNQNLKNDIPVSILETNIDTSNKSIIISRKIIERKCESMKNSKASNQEMRASSIKIGKERLKDSNNNSFSQNKVDQNKEINFSIQIYQPPEETPKKQELHQNYSPAEKIMENNLVNSVVLSSKVTSKTAEKLQKEKEPKIRKSSTENLDKLLESMLLSKANKPQFRPRKKNQSFASNVNVSQNFSLSFQAAG